MILEWIEDLCALEQTGNFSRAARKRHITQSAFSRRIQALENWVGASLINRANGRSELSDAGKVFHAGARSIINELQILREETAIVSGRHRIGVRFAVTQTLSVTFFPDWILSLSEGSSTIGFQLSAGALQDCKELMLMGEVDFLICYQYGDIPTILPDYSFQSQIIGNDSLMAVSSKDKADFIIRGMKDKHYPKLPYLRYASESAFSPILDYCESKLENRFSRVEVMTSSLAAVIKSMVAKGLGIGWLPLSLIEGDLSTGKLIRVIDVNIPLEVRLYRSISNLTTPAEEIWRRVTAEAQS